MLAKQANKAQHLRLSASDQFIIEHRYVLTACVDYWTNVDY